MSTFLILLLSGAVLIIGFTLLNHYRTKKTEKVKKSDKILVLTKKNFVPGTKRGLVLIDFWASKYPLSKEMLPVLNEIAEAQIENLTVAKVNAEYEKQLVAKFKIKSIPTLILFKEGEEYKRFVGVKTKRFLMKEINS
jgi:thioredoxin 1